MIVTGIVISAVALILVVTSGVLVATAVGGPLSESLSSPSRPTPVDEQLALKAGHYTVFELTGRQSSSGPITTTRFGPPTVTPDSIEVTGPDGVPIEASGFGAGSSESMTRGQDIYTGAARFAVPEPGIYHVRVASPATVQVVIAPSFGSGLGAVWGWFVAGAAGFVALVGGVILIVVGSLRQRAARRPAQFARRPAQYAGYPAGSASPPIQDAGPPAGWYPAPDVAERQRYWDGHAWTDQLR